MFLLFQLGGTVFPKVNPDRNILVGEFPRFASRYAKGGASPLAFGHPPFPFDRLVKHQSEISSSLMMKISLYIQADIQLIQQYQIGVILLMAEIRLTS